MGRPTVVTPESIIKLEMAFSNGASDKEACFIAGIGMSTLYDYCTANPDFSEKKEALKDMLKYQARKNVAEQLHAQDIETSKWYLERKAKNEFAQRSEITGDKGEKLFDNFKDKTTDELLELSRKGR